MDKIKTEEVGGNITLCVIASCFGLVMLLGDIVKAVVTKGARQGEYLGRVAVRSKKSFNIETKNGLVKDIGYKYCHLIQRNDGYSYNYKKRNCDAKNK